MNLACCYIFISQIVLHIDVIMIILPWLRSICNRIIYKYSKHAVQNHNVLATKVAMFEFNDSL